MSPSPILVINAGSSSIKFALFDMAKSKMIVSCLAESLGENAPRISFLSHIKEQKTEPKVVTLDSSTQHKATSNHQQAIQVFLSLLKTHIPNAVPYAIGHRVVHGGEFFKNAVIINDTVIKQIKACIPLAPLHNAANLLGIEATYQAFAGLPQAAIFDTAFHQTLPEKTFLYPIPLSLYKQYGIRRYGFHGTSHQYVCEQAAKQLQIPLSNAQFISAHLGNGCSITAVKNGKSIDTSMGLTPLEGLMMGTRSGSIDPGLFEYLENKGYTITEITQMLNKQSGLLGISRLSNDMRTLLQASNEGNNKATLAIEMFCFRLAKYIGAMSISLNRLDGLIFTGGIGEHAAPIREKTVASLSLLGLAIDKERNMRHGKESNLIISRNNTTNILVIPTNEEWMIAKETQALID